MSFVLRTPAQQWGAGQIWPWLQAPAALPERVAFQGSNCAAYILHLLRAWHQGTLTFLLDPKLPVLEVQRLLHQEQIHLCQQTDHLDTPALQTFAESLPAPESLAPFKRSVNVIRTSGSSGTPKLAQHSWGNHVYSARGSLQYLPLAPEDSWLLSLPLFHVGGLAIVVRCWLAGAQLQVPDPEQPLAEALLMFQPTHLSLVPTQLQRLLALPELVQVLQRCKAILLGGAPVSPALLRTAQAAGLAVHTSYGSTEMSSQITTTPSGFWHNTPVQEGAVASGALLPYRQLRLHEGEIEVRGETLFQGYREGGQLRFSLRSGWWPTGDLGRWQGEQLFVVGRKDNQFISGGENIQPEEIETYLLRYTGVKLAMVVPVADVEFGERPVAFLQMDGLTAPSEGPLPPARVAELRTFLAQYVPRFKIPMAFYAWPGQLQGGKLKPGRRDFKAYAQQLWQAQADIDT